ncbi:hypothetical protein, partial [Nocardia sp. NPDC050789]|uniref:hypothetical protein n=1 Tax=Nocardia sp. NPDC050789 TaxID=3154841 RepID=UPI0033F94530
LLDRAFLMRRRGTPFSEPLPQRHQTKSADPGNGMVKQMPTDPSTGVACGSLADAADAPARPSDSMIAVAATVPAILAFI